MRPVAWRYRIKKSDNKYGQWTVQKNLPSWYHSGMIDVQLQPLVVMDHIIARDGEE